MANGNGANLSPGAVITIVLAILAASNGIMFWALADMKEQIGAKTVDRYTGSDARRDQAVTDQKFKNHEFRIEQLEDFVHDYRREGGRQ